MGPQYDNVSSDVASAIYWCLYYKLGLTETLTHTAVTEILKFVKIQCLSLASRCEKIAPEI